MTAYITTFSGRTINLASPSHKDIDIGDIAHALSLLCRFNGHCRDFYSVAEHSVRVSLLLEDLAKDYGHEEHTQKLCLMGLLHDAAEAYPPGDIAGPLKKLLQDEYGVDGLSVLDVQSSFDNAVRTHFDLGAPFENAWSLVELADRMMLAWEWRDIMGCRVQDKPDGIGNPHTEEKLWPWHSIKAEVAFLGRFQKLAPERSLLGALCRLVPDPMAEPEKGGWRTQLNALVLKECERAMVEVTAEAVRTKLPVRRKGEERPSIGDVQTATTTNEGAWNAEISVEVVPEHQGIECSAELAEALEEPPVEKPPKKRKRKKRRKCGHERLAQNGKCLNCDQQVLTSTKPKRRKRKKKRKGYSDADVKRMIAEAVEAQAVDSMSAPKREAPGSSPDFAQPVPKKQKMGPTKAERAAMDDPDIREQESENVKGGGGLGAAAYD